MGSAEEDPDRAKLNCSIKGKFVEPCTWLLRRLQDNKGLMVMEIMNVRTSEPTRRILVHKLDARDKGHCCNFCPFCGVDLREAIK